MMMDRLRSVVPKGFIDNELVELKEHRFRVGFLLFSVCVLFAFLLLEEEQVDPQAPPVESAPTLAAAPEPPDTSERRSEIIGLARASEDVQLINPFAVDLPKPAPEPLIIPIVTAPPPPPPPPLTVYEEKFTPSSPPLAPEPHIMISLKGTAISDDKKLAVVHREIVLNKSDEYSDTRSENRLLKIGEEIDGHRVIDIGKDFIVFDDGERLELPRARNDD